MDKKSWLALSALLFVIGFVFFAHEDVEDVEQGNYYFGRGKAYNLEKAAFYYERALKRDSTVADAWHQLARIDFLKGDFTAALEKINRQIELHGKSLMSSYYIRGLIYGYTKEYIKAEQDFKTFLTWDPKNWAALNDLAWIYFVQGKFKEAEETAARGLLVDPDNPWLLTMRGMSRFNMGGQSQEPLHDLVRARDEMARLSERDWIRAYPGNDPRIASAGLTSMRRAIEDNLILVNKQIAN